MKTWTLTAVLLLGLILTACDKPQPPAATKSETDHKTSGRVAVVNVDDVARALGWMKELENAVNTQTQDFQVQLNALRNRLADAFNEQQRKVGPNPTTEQKQQLAQMENALTNQLLSAKSQAEAQVNQLRFSMVTQYRDLVRPVARRLAAERGLTVVLSLPMEQIMYFDPTVDITSAVIDELQKNPPAKVTIPPTSQPAALGK